MTVGKTIEHMERLRQSVENASLMGEVSSEELEAFDLCVAAYKQPLREFLSRDVPFRVSDKQAPNPLCFGFTADETESIFEGISEELFDRDTEIFDNDRICNIIVQGVEEEISAKYGFPEENAEEIFNSIYDCMDELYDNTVFDASKIAELVAAAAKEADGDDDGRIQNVPEHHAGN